MDLSYLPDDWNSKKGYWGSSEDLLNKRVSKVRQWLKARPEKNIVVITHGGLVHYLTDDWNDSDKFPGVCISPFFVSFFIFLFFLKIS